MSRKRSGFAITSVRGGAGTEPEPEHAEHGTSGSSRFRLIRLPVTGETLRRGRWICRDFYDRDNAGSNPVPLSRPPSPPNRQRPGGGTDRLSACLGLTGTGSGEDSSSSAIDNKIEQAMDLVKSHLLLAVREEVELLKEQIKELNERRVMLERENGALRAIATPQQLARLQPPPPLTSSPNP